MVGIITVRNTKLDLKLSHSQSIKRINDKGQWANEKSYPARFEVNSLTSCKYHNARVGFKVVRSHLARCSTKLLTHYWDNRARVKVIDNQEVLDWTQEETTHFLVR